MKEIVSQYKNIITAQLDGGMQTLGAVAVLARQAGADGINDVPLYLEGCMKEMNEQNDFLRMGAVSSEGLGYFVNTDGTKRYGTDVGGEKFVRRTLNGERMVSDVEEDKLPTESVIFCGISVTHDGNAIGTVTATRTADSLSEIINCEVFDGVAFIHIVDQSGDFTLRSDHAVVQKEMDNIFDEGDVTKETKASILADIKNGEDSFAISRCQGKGYWVTFIPVGINDQQTFCLVLQTLLGRDLDTVFLVYLCIVVCTVILFMILSLYIYSPLRGRQEVLQVLACEDVLTGTGNRNGFMSEPPALLEKQVDHALVLMNISGFKFVNEFFGSERGDALLQHIAGVLKYNVGEGERCYRDNADHFGMLLLYNGRKGLIDRFRRIHGGINSYIVSPNQGYRINCNFGMHIIRGKDKKGSLLSPDGTINGALLALDSVSGNMTNPFIFYDEATHEKVRKKIETASQMHVAPTNGEFRMYLQPKYNLVDKPLHSTEALVRWYMADGVIHCPDESIPVSEESGSIAELDMLILEEACRQAVDWRRQGYDIRPISVSQPRIFFYDKKYFDKFYEVVSQYHIDPPMIILEVTESVAMSSLERMKKVIGKSRSMELSTPMDDFGSGYSSLNTLKNLDIAELKLGRGFLSEQSTFWRGRIAVESVVHLARALSITTVTEGIENLAQLEFMKSIHYNIRQGYYFVRPMPVEEFERTVLHMREG